MKLLGNGWTTAESTFGGSTAGAGGYGSEDSAMGAGPGGFLVQKIVAQSNSTVICNTSGMLHFRYGDSSDAIASTMIILGGSPHALTSVTIPQVQSIVLDGLNIRCNWFEFASQELAAGGYLGFVFGK